MRLLKFYSDGCQPCKTLTTKLDELGVVYTSINIDEQPDLVEEYYLRGVPTLIIVNENMTEVDRRLGIPRNLEEFVSGFKK